MTLTGPLMLIGLAALPALAAIYWLRSRSRRLVVSSLVLYANQRRSRQGGRIFQRMQTPVTFFLEILALALIVLAASGPAWRTRETARPIVVVLDDSFSMQARSGADSPRSLAAAALLDELADGNYQARFVLAGPQPALLGEPVETPEQASDVLRQWRCTAAQADLGEAIAMAREIGGQAARVLVLTDHAPSWPLEAGQVQWWAFGRAMGNFAFTAAARTRLDDRQRLLLEVANLGGEPGVAQLALIDAGGTTTRAMELGASRRGRLILELGADTAAIRAELADDCLDIDNRVLLLAPADRPLRVSVLLPPGPLRQAVAKALEATGGVLISPDRPELVISDQPPTPGGDAWHMRLVSAGPAQAYAGPFVIDRGHPLTEGLSLGGVIWSCPTDAALAGTPILTAGNTVLLAGGEGPGRRQQLEMAIDPEMSNVVDSPDWPILFANLVRWRLEQLGLVERNVRLGSRVALTMPLTVEQVEWLAPGRAVVRLPAYQGRVELTADAVGLHTVSSPARRLEFACNALAPGESDLLLCATGRWGSWNESPMYRDSLLPLAWVAALAALMAMVAHLAVVSRAAGRRSP